MKKLICLALACVMLVSFMTGVFAADAKTEATFLFVAENGDDAAKGTIDAPFKTIAAAVKAAEGISGTVVINIRKGTYQMTDTISLTEANSDLVIRAYNNEDVLVTGGTVLPFDAFKKCTDTKFLDALLVSGAKDKVVSANIKELGVEDLGEIKRQGFASGEGDNLGYAPTLTYNEKALTIARYPNEGYLYTKDIIRTGTEEDAKTYFNGRSKQVEFTLEDTRYTKWNGKDAWAVGYYQEDWADSTSPAEFTEKSVIAYDGFRGVTSNRRVYFFNIPEELDLPGEWYLNRETGVLYMIPAEGMKAGDTLIYNGFNKNFFDLTKVKNVSFIGIKFNGTCCKGINILECDGIYINDCEFTGIGDSAVYAKDCYRVRVENSYFHDLGSRGVYFIDNGDKMNLIPSECAIVNCHFHTFSQYKKTYAPAVHVTDDVATLIAHSEFHDAPHFAIRYEGNDLVLEYNDFYDVCQDTADTGAVYTGRRWETRGNIFRYNYIHDMTEVKTTTGHKKWGLYLDDTSASTKVYGNIFNRIDSVILAGGGRNNEIINNIIVDCRDTISFDARGLSWTSSWLQEDGSGSLYKKLQQYPYKEGIWAEKYPELVNLLEDEPKVPKYNVIKNNIFYRTPEFRINEEVQKHGTIENNYEISSSKEFIDYRNGNFNLAPDSKTLKLLPEFEAIPIDKIGRYEYTVEDNFVEAGASSKPALDTIKVLLKGDAIDFADVAPQIINDRTMVPLRAIFEALGAEVAWDDATKTVTAKKGDVTIKMTIGADSFTKNDEKIALDSPATIVDSRTLVPVRAIAESFGSKVGWIAETKTVTIED